MNRRQYLIGAGAGISALPIVSRRRKATDHISVEITETNTPLEGGDLLDMAGELENNGSGDERVELDFVVGEDEEVVSQRTIPVEARETREVDFLQFRTYPVRDDDSFPARLQTEADVAEITVDVLGVDEFDSQYAYPERDQELTVQPETRVHFEIDDELVENQGITHWYVDGEYITTPMGPRSSTYFYDVGREYFTYTFKSEGSYTVDAAVTTSVDNAASRWDVTVTDDGPEPPTVDGSRPDTSELGADESTTLELDVSTSDTDLDRVVWWMTQSDVILDVSDISGSSDTASIDIDGGCHTCRIESWAMDENNVCTVADPWEFEEYEPEDETPADELTGLLAEWAEMIGEAHGIEVLDISDSSDQAWYFYYQTEGVIDAEEYELGAVADAYAWLVDEHPDEAPDDLFVYAVGDPDPDSLSDGAVGAFYIEREWAEEWLAGWLTDEEYSVLVIATYEEDPA
ncbi:hypothetical protein [Natrialba sp. INN-245]|uniref:hypothetical protein n=1 Tax=Natrialba sp. INN-245 TaxID=2690967 RepID=UPI00190F6294|nr:hypothetical protein [Natrialba sp. INN-245]